MTEIKEKYIICPVETHCPFAPNALSVCGEYIMRFFSSACIPRYTIVYLIF